MSEPREYEQRSHVRMKSEHGDLRIFPAIAKAAKLRSNRLSLRTHVHEITKGI